MENEKTIEELYQETPEENSRAYWETQAKLFNINYPKNITTSKLKALVQDRLSRADDKLIKDFSSIAEKQFQDLRALVRVEIKNLNPAKSSWTGEFFTVGNDAVPPITRFVPYNAVDNIWHLERIFIPFLESKEYSEVVHDYDAKKQINFKRVKKGKEFHIRELPPLTPEELEDLKKLQALQNTGITENHNN